MPKQIQVENEIIEFPDNMPDNEIEAIIKREFYNQPQQQPQQNQALQQQQRQQRERQQIANEEGRIGSLATTATNVLPGMPRIKAITAALSAKAFMGGDETIGDFYDEALKNELTKLSIARKKYPIQSPVSEIVGGAGLGNKLLQVAGLGGYALKSVIGGGGLLGASYAAGETPDLTSKQAIKDTATGGALGVAGGAVIKGAGAIASKATQLGKDVLAGYKARPVETIAGFVSKPVETLDSVNAAIKNNASNIYKTFRKSGGVLKSETTESIFNGIDNSLKESGILNPRLHGDTIGVLNDLKSLAKQKNGEIGLEELDQYRQLLGDVVKKNTDISGKINADALKSNIAIDKLDEIVENLGDNALLKGDRKTLDLLKSARTEWSKHRKFDAISNLVRKADNDPNKLKTLLQNFVNNPKNLRGFNSEQIEALKRAKTNSTAEGLMKAIGKFGFDIGSGRNNGNSVLPIGSILIGGGTGGVAAGIGTVARQAQKLSAKGQIENVLKLIEGQKPKISNKSKTTIDKNLIKKFANDYLKSKNITNATSIIAGKLSAQQQEE